MSEWLVWQVVDSAFPTGAFAHSFGLEAAWQQGELNDNQALQPFLEACICQAAHGTLPLMTAAYRDPDSLPALDALADAFLTNPVANRASRVQGRTFVATASRVWPGDAMRELRARAEETCAHLAPLSGVIFATIALPLATSQCVVLYGVVRGVLSAAVRLGVIGSYEAQRLQHACGGHVDEMLARCGTLGATDLAQTAPILDLLHAGHDRLYSRLFQS